MHHSPLEAPQRPSGADLPHGSRPWSSLYECHALPLVLEAERRVSAVLALVLRGGQRWGVHDDHVPVSYWGVAAGRKKSAVRRAPRAEGSVEAVKPRARRTAVD